MDLNIRIAGEAGQGVQTTGELLVGALAATGLHVYATQSYMSRIRGGLNWVDVRIADRELHAPVDTADVLVALSAAAVEILGPHRAESGVTLFDADQGDGGVVAIDLTAAAEQAGGSKVMANTVAAGAVFALLGYDLNALCDYLRTQFAKKGDEVVEKNIRCARKGAELMGKTGRRLKAPPPAGAPRQVTAGAEAIAQAAARAGVKFVTAYPMTPSTATLNALAARADQYGFVVEQAEDEIAAINMVCGATYAGAPAMTMTSGGGFALMVEGLALAGMLELPVVILLGQRPGPATGLPTRTAQQDLKFALSAGHGEFVRAIYAPGTIPQCRELTRLAFQTAHKVQTPVIILTDQFLQDLQVNDEPPEENCRPSTLSRDAQRSACRPSTFSRDAHRSACRPSTLSRDAQRSAFADPIDPCIERRAGEDYHRYAVTDSGVSPRAVPGGDAFVVADSDEHTLDGHITEDLEVRVAQQDKRMRKGNLLAAEALPPAWHGPQDAETVLIAWGSTYGPCRSAVDALNARGGSAAMMHFSQVWPIDTDAVRKMLGRRKRLLCVEGNCTGQFASVLRERGVIGEVELVLRYDGLPFTAEYIQQQISQG